MTDYRDAAHAKLETPDTASLTTFPAREHTPVVEWRFPEFQCLCPVSARHDAGEITVRYRPAAQILESKAVRDYLAKWRTKRNWQEYVTEEIADILYASCEPDWLIVSIHWAPRGGIFATTRATRGNPPASETKRISYVGSI